METEQNSIRVFYSYAKEDEKLQKRLEIHLSNLKNRGIISSWHSKLILAGQDIDKEVNMHLANAQIVLLLVSPFFLASDYYFSVEMNKTMQRHETKQCYVIPIIMRPTIWQDALFGKLQALPINGKPITMWRNQDDAFSQVAQEIQKIALSMQNN